MDLLNTIRTKKLLSSTLILITLSIGILIGTLVNTGVRAAKENQAAPGATPLVIPNPVQLSTAFTQLAKQLQPSVVNISTTYEAKAPSVTKKGNRRRAVPDEDENGGGDDNNMQDFFQRFFGNPFGGGGSGEGGQGHRGGAALGSGVIV